MDQPSKTVLARRFPTAFVTGGSSGLGKVFVDSLLQEGVEVWASSRQVERIAKADRLHAIELDLCSKEDLERLLASPPWGRETPSLLINNAGYGLYSRWNQLEPEDLERQIVAMLWGPARLSHYFLQSKVSLAPAVVQVTSLAVEFPLPFFHGYNLVKSALSGLTQSLMLEYPGGSPTRPFVIDFRPGDFRTGFNQASLRKNDPSLEKLWLSLEKHLQDGADPSTAWKSLRKSLLKEKSSMVRTGTFFQSKAAPFLARFFPAGWVRWAHAKYYGL